MRATKGGVRWPRLHADRTLTGSACEPRIALQGDRESSSRRLGIADLFAPGSPLQDIVDWLRDRFPETAPAPAR